MIQNRVVRRLLLVGLTAALLTLVLHASGLAAPIVTPGPQDQLAIAAFTNLPLVTKSHEGMPIPNCKYGVAVNLSTQTPWVEQLGAGWYLNFGPYGTDLPNGSEFARVVRVKQDKSGCCTYLPTYRISPPLTETALGALVDSEPLAVCGSSAMSLTVARTRLTIRL